jgi:hypothetical protein
VRIEDVQPLVPPELKIVSIWPGRTLGVVAFAHYGQGSALEYDELIVAPAVVRHGTQWGVWVSHIYVDHPDSLIGGREIWGMPKELAEFHWSDDDNVAEASATLRGRLLARVRVDRRWWLMTGRLRFPTFSQRGNDLIRFVGETKGRLGWGRGHREIPSDSPLSFIRMGRPWSAIWVQGMQLVCGVPSNVGRTSFTVEPYRWVAQPALRSVEPASDYRPT